MNIKLLSNQLSKIYNTLGNDWLVSNYETKPFEFRVFVRKGDDKDLRDYEVEVYTDRFVPNTFKYRDSNKNKMDGSHISVIENHFKNLATYLDTSFGEFRKTIGVTFMDKDYKDK